MRECVQKRERGGMMRACERERECVRGRESLLSVVSYFYISCFFCLIITDYYTKSLYVYVRSALSYGDGGELRSHKACSNPSHKLVDVQSQEPHRH